MWYRQTQEERWTGEWVLDMTECQYMLAMIGSQRACLTPGAARKWVSDQRMEQRAESARGWSFERKYTSCSDPRVVQTSCQVETSGDMIHDSYGVWRVWSDVVHRQQQQFVGQSHHMACTCCTTSQLGSPHTATQHTRAFSMPSLILWLSLSLLLVLTATAVAAYLAYPRWTAHRQRRALTAQLTARLALLLNTRDSLIQHIDWAKADHQHDRAHALTHEVRAIDADTAAVEKQLKAMEAHRRRVQY